MPYIIAKYLLTAAVIVLISELAKRSDKLGALIASLPLVTIVTLIWLHLDQQPTSKIANHAYYTFWYVIPTLPMFFFFPMLLEKFSFWSALTVFVVAMMVIFAVFAFIMKRFGVDLL
ncbi:MAG: DUF3147 family protein [Agitococcus sp.]|jgi:hypothetical protein|nr:DUF3147 family protein [Agitococcus sp.]